MGPNLDSRFNFIILFLNLDPSPPLHPPPPTSRSGQTWISIILSSSQTPWLAPTSSNYENTQFFRLSVCHAKGVTFFRLVLERLNSNSRVAFDHQIVIIIIKSKTSQKNLKKKSKKKIKNKNKKLKKYNL